MVVVCRFVEERSLFLLHNRRLLDQLVNLIEIHFHHCAQLKKSGGCFLFLQMLPRQQIVQNNILLAAFAYFICCSCAVAHASILCRQRQNVSLCKLHRITKHAKLMEDGRGRESFIASQFCRM
ncbi:hypothetical protein T4D_16119 [Trichinella pseudospiralis]|uniref:Uncharacterized protein n=1 Tax=Trichinella pseudospiralis TaxID=6337 RepID=A0A0V1G3Z1_TRIPS|nr:hypothetical protein T4D_16119 [Trichinella pseudospiralis]